MSEQSNPLADIAVDTENLYREETFSDLKVASIRRLTPVTAEGLDDPSRPTLFIGETTLMSARGPLPINCPIEAENLNAAFAAFPQAVQEAVERLMEEARELQRQEANRIVVPGHLVIVCMQIWRRHDCTSWCCRFPHGSVPAQTWQGASETATARSRPPPRCQCCRRSR